jgi:hypothetical protein
MIPRSRLHIPDITRVACTPIRMFVVTRFSKERKRATKLATLEGPRNGIFVTNGAAGGVDKPSTLKERNIL